MTTRNFKELVRKKYLKRQRRLALLHEELRGEEYPRGSLKWVWHNRLARNAYLRYLAHGGTQEDFKRGTTCTELQ